MNSINIIHGYEKLKGWIIGKLDSIIPNQELNTEISTFVGVLVAAVVIALSIIALCYWYYDTESKKLLHLVIFIVCLPLIITIIILAFTVLFVLATAVCYVAIFLIFSPFRLLKCIF